MRFLMPILLSVSLIITEIPLNGATNKLDSIVDESNKITVNVNTGFCDKYLWRGITYNKGLVFQPEVIVSYKDFSLSSWGNFKLWDVNGTNSNEIDFTLDYYHSFNSFNLDGYLSYYHYFYAPEDNTSEFNLGVYYPSGGFTFFARSSYDILAYRWGTLYGELGFDYEKEISDQFSVFGTLLAGFGSKEFNSNYLDIEKSAFNLTSCDLGLSYSPIENFSIDADFLMNINIDKDVRKALGTTSSLVEIILRKEF